jgi:hypothetical protein
MATELPMNNNRDEIQYRFEPGRNADLQSCRFGRVGKPTVSSCGLDDGILVSLPAESAFLPNEPIMSMKTNGHRNPVAANPII